MANDLRPLHRRVGRAAAVLVRLAGMRRGDCDVAEMTALYCIIVFGFLFWGTLLLYHILRLRTEVNTMALTTAAEIRTIIAKLTTAIALIEKLKALLPGTLENDPELAAEVDAAIAMEIPSDPTDPPADPVTE